MVVARKWHVPLSAPHSTFLTLLVSRRLVSACHTKPFLGGGMHTVRRFTYPTFIGLCGLLATISDMLQNQMVAIGVVIALAAIGLASVLTPTRFLIWSGIAEQLGIDEAAVSARRPFGLSCLILAAVVFGFSAMSVRAAEDGGLVAGAFPEVRQMQVSLGIIEREVQQIAAKTSEIKQDTAALMAATLQWISVDTAPKSTGKVTPDGEIHYYLTGGMYFTVSNDTANAF